MTREAAADPAALAEERDAALALLHDLDRQRSAGELDETDHEALREAATARAARALRSLQELGSGEAGEPGSSPRAPGGRRRWALAGGLLALVVAAGVLAGALLASHATGGHPVADAHLPAQLREARALVAKGEDAAAAKLFGRILASYPEQPEALAYDGWLLRLAGLARHDQSLIERGRAMEGEAVLVDPSYPDAHLFLGRMLYQDAHDPAAAVTQFDDFLAAHPAPALVAGSASVMRSAFEAEGKPLPSLPAS